MMFRVLLRNNVFVKYFLVSMITRKHRIKKQRGLKVCLPIFSNNVFVWMETRNFLTMSLIGSSTWT